MLLKTFKVFIAVFSHEKFVALANEFIFNVEMAFLSVIVLEITSAIAAGFVGTK